MANFHNFTATHNCLSGCVNDYFVRPLRGSTNFLEGSLEEDDSGRGGIDVENYSPFISLQIGENQKILTVGNKSYPDDNTACIKSIDFGWIDSVKGTIEILDQKGSELSVFMESLQKCASRVGAGSVIKYKVGWVYSGCGDRSGSKIESPEMKAILGKIDVNYGPVMKYRLELTTIEPLVFTHRHPITFGEESPGKDMHLEDAIIELCKLPPEVNVKFCQYDDSRNLVCQTSGLFDWENGGKKGPRACWKGDRENKYTTITRWIHGYKIKSGKKGKAAILIHDPKNYNDLIILKDPTPDPGEQAKSSKNDSLHLGTYIVNGGKCSNVIEFSPQINLIGVFGSYSSGGGTSGGIKSSNVNIESYKNPETEGKNCCNSKDAGVQQQTTVTTENIYTYGQEAPEKVTEANLAYQKANKITKISMAPIKADLKIIGDPRPEFFGMASGKAVSVVVINPNHLQGGDENVCGDWLKKSDCNEYLSNKIWLVQGINHTIQEGSYVTTLKIMLPLPGVDNAYGEKLGANESGKEIKSPC